MLSRDKRNYRVLISVFLMLKIDQNFLIYFKSLNQFYNLDAPKAVFSTIIEHLMSADVLYFVVNSNQHVICTLTSHQLTVLYMQCPIFICLFSKEKGNYVFPV